MNHSSIHGRVKRFFCCPECPDLGLGPNKCHVLWVLGIQRPGHASDHLHVVLRLRIIVAIPLLPFHHGVDRNDSVLNDIRPIPHSLCSAC